MTLAPSLDGYYDQKGEWQRTKFCFVDCGDRCTCMSPMGMHQLAVRPRPKAPDHTVHPWTRNRAALARMQADMNELVRGHSRQGWTA